MVVYVGISVFVGLDSGLYSLLHVCWYLWFGFSGCFSFATYSGVLIWLRCSLDLWCGLCICFGVCVF